MVTAERAPEPRESVPAAVSVLTRREIERLPAENLAELLRFLPGFHVHFAAGFGGAPMVSSRGFFGGGEAEYVQLLIDGVPVADVESGLADWKRIRAADVERIEALRGPASSLYGDTALGGLIQVFTRNGAGVPRRGSVSASGGSFGSIAVDVAGRAPAGRSSLAASLTASRTDGYRDHSDAEDAGGDVSLELPAGAGTWTFSLSGSRREREEAGPRTREELSNDRSGSDPLFRFDREETKRGRAAAVFRGGGEKLPFRALLHASIRESEIHRTLLVAAGVGDPMFRSTETGAIGGSVEAEKPFASAGREGRVVAGVDFARETLESAYREVGVDGAAGSEVARASGDRERFGVFLSGSWEPLTRLRLTAGARFDSIADAFGRDGASSRSAWSPRVGATLRLGRSPARPVSLFVQASRAFKAPTIDQLFDPRPFPDFSGGTFRISNLRLLPQRAETIEAGISGRGKRTRFEIVAYRTEVKDEIDFDIAAFRYANIGRTLHRGIEASASFLSEGPVSPFVSWAWTPTEPREGENRGRQLKNVPEHVLRPGLALSFPGGVRLQAVATYVSGRFLDDGNQFPLDDTLVVDLRLERAFGRLRARADLLNVGDRDWEEVGLLLSDFEGRPVPYYFPAAGFAARLGIDWTF